MSNRSRMRVAVPLLWPLLCLGLAACAGPTVSGEPPAADAGAANPAPAASATASQPPRRAASGGGGARGGATTASWGAAEPTEVRPDILVQARADCWMMVEHKRELRGIDQRIAFVDRCVADQMKSKPNP
jgi:hypothetical protein